MTRKPARRGSDRKNIIVREILTNGATSKYLKGRAQVREFLGQYLGNPRFQLAQGAALVAPATSVGPVQ